MSAYARLARRRRRRVPAPPPAVAASGDRTVDLARTYYVRPPADAVTAAVAIAARNVDPRPYYVLTPPPPLLPAAVLASLMRAGELDQVADYRRRVRDLGGTW